MNEVHILRFKSSFDCYKERYKHKGPLGSSLFKNTVSLTALGARDVINIDPLGTKNCICRFQ